MLFQTEKEKREQKLKKKQEFKENLLNSIHGQKNFFWY